MRRIGARLLELAVTVLVVSIATFVLIDLLPGDAALAMIGERENAYATPADIDALREELGLNDPVPVRYLEWVGNAVTGDLGTSIRSTRPVTVELRERLPVTLQLAVMAVAMGFLLSVPLGIWSAAMAGRGPDRTTVMLSSAVMSLPPFILGLLTVYLFALTWEVFPVTGWIRLTEDVGQNLRHAFLPSLSLSLAEAAVYTQLLRADMVNTLQEDFILAARTKGLSKSAVLFRHALRPSSFSLLTLSTVNLGRLLGGTVIVEHLFGLPGVGRLIIQAIPGQDLPVIQGSVLMLAVTFLVLNVVVDLTYALLDPRVRRPTL